MDSVVITITLIGAAAMTIVSIVAVAKGQFEQPIPIKVEDDSRR